MQSEDAPFPRTVEICSVSQQLMLALLTSTLPRRLLRACALPERYQCLLTAGCSRVQSAAPAKNTPNAAVVTVAEFKYCCFSALPQQGRTRPKAQELLLCGCCPLSLLQQSLLMLPTEVLPNNPTAWLPTGCGHRTADLARLKLAWSCAGLGLDIGWAEAVRHDAAVPASSAKSCCGQRCQKDLCLPTLPASRCRGARAACGAAPSVEPQPRSDDQVRVTQARGHQWPASCVRYPSREPMISAGPTRPRHPPSGGVTNDQSSLSAARLSQVTTPPLRRAVHLLIGMSASSRSIGCA